MRRAPNAPVSSHKVEVRTTPFTVEKVRQRTRPERSNTYEIVIGIADVTRADQTVIRHARTRSRTEDPKQKLGKVEITNL